MAKPSDPRCPDCHGEGATGCPGGYLETCDRCGGSGLVRTAHDCHPDDWVEEYYGYRCRVCGVFVPFGCEPWAPDDGEVADMVRDAFAETREQAERERAGERLEPGLEEFRMREEEASQDCEPFSSDSIPW